MNIKTIRTLAVAAALTGCAQGQCQQAAAGAPAPGNATTVVWQTLGNTIDKAGKTSYTQRFTVTGDTDFPRLAFNMFARGMEALNPADTLVEIFPGYYYVATPRLKAAKGKPVDIDIKVSALMRASVYAPDGVHRVNNDGTTSPVNYTRSKLTRPEQWSSAKEDRMPYGPAIYDTNEARKTDWVPGVYDVVPSYKKITPLPGTSKIQNMVFNTINPENPDYYTIRVSGDSLVISCREDRQYAVYVPFLVSVLNKAGNQQLPNVFIEDWPDFPWRGLHIDIARNYQTPETLNHVLELMSVARLNRLHFHPFDDEAWRLEIPGLPELTEVGARRGYSANGEGDHLYQIFAGDGNPDTKGNSANGYWTRQEFIDFLKHANSLGIEVLTEIESPGHARAAIKAMEARAAHGDPSYRLIHDGDTSKYTSAQSYHDNALNPALPGPYKFMGKVFDELIAMYREAGVPIPGIHIGGDEVPRGGWNGSDSIRVFMERKGLKTQHDVHGYFVKEMAKMLKERNVPMFGWEEIAVGHDADFNAEVAPVTGGVNVWHITPDAAVKAVRGGFPVILSNVNRFYLDMSPSYHPEEKGLTWGGTVDEFDALGGYPKAMCPVDLDTVPGKVIGVQGQVWAETIRNAADLYRMLLPKMFGMAERAWNADSTWTEAQFNAIMGEKLLDAFTAPRLVLAVRMRQPGIKVIDGKVHMNAPYNGGEIRYTTDGTEPDRNSTLYTDPFPAVKGQDVRARYYRNNAESLTTYLPRH